MSKQYNELRKRYLIKEDRYIKRIIYKYTNEFNLKKTSEFRIKAEDMPKLIRELSEYCLPDIPKL